MRPLPAGRLSCPQPGALEKLLHGLPVWPPVQLRPGVAAAGGVGPHGYGRAPLTDALERAVKPVTVHRMLYGYDIDDVVVTPLALRAIVRDMRRVDGLLRAEVAYVARPQQTALVPAHLLTRWRPPR